MNMWRWVFGPSKRWKRMLYWWWMWPVGSNTQYVVKGGWHGAWIKRLPLRRSIINKR